MLNLIKKLLDLQAKPSDYEEEFASQIVFFELGDKVAAEVGNSVVFGVVTELGDTDDFGNEWLKVKYFAGVIGYLETWLTLTNVETVESILMKLGLQSADVAAAMAA